MDHAATDIAPVRKGPKRHDWQAIDPQLRAMIAEGRSRRQIFEDLDLPRATLNKRLDDLGLSTAGHPGNRFDAGRKRRIKHTAGRWSPSAEMLRLRRQCAEAFGATDEEILGRRRTNRISLARQATAFVLRRRFVLSTPKVGAALGGLCHTTVLHGCRYIDRQMRRDRDLAAKVLRLMQGRAPRQHDAHVIAWAVDRLPESSPPVPPKLVSSIFQDEELAEFIDPARVFCGQCDRSVLPAEAARCASRLCGLRERRAA